MLSNFRALVYLNKNKVGSPLHFLYMKVFNLAYKKSHPGHFKNINLNLRLPEDQWGGSMNNETWILGNDETTIEKNLRIRRMIMDLEIVYFKLLKSGKEPYASEIVAVYKNGVQVKTRKQLLPYLLEYCDNNKLAGKTRDTYLVNFKPAFKEFLRLKYNSNDVYLDDIDTAMFFRFELYMTKATSRWGKPYATGTIRTYIDKFMAVMSYAKRMGEIEKDPGEAYQPTDILTEEKATNIISSVKEAMFWKVSPTDLSKIETLTIEGYGIRGDTEGFKNDRDIDLWRVRLLFLFQTWSGMAVADLDKYKEIKNFIRNDLSGQRCIIYNRTKTGELAVIPLFPQMTAILEALQYNISTQSSYDTYNRRIKALLRYYNIECEDDSTHLGRHIFGSRMITMGFTMESVSRMMGHENSRYTEKVYARIDITKIYADYDRVKNGEVKPNHQIAI